MSSNNKKEHTHIQKLTVACASYRLHSYLSCIKVCIQTITARAHTRSDKSWRFAFFNKILSSHVRHSTDIFGFCFYSRRRRCCCRRCRHWLLSIRAYMSWTTLVQFCMRMRAYSKRSIYSIRSQNYRRPIDCVYVVKQGTTTNKMNTNSSDSQIDFVLDVVVSAQKIENSSSNWWNSNSMNRHDRKQFTM